MLAAVFNLAEIAEVSSSIVSGRRDQDAVEQTYLNLLELSPPPDPRAIQAKARYINDQNEHSVIAASGIYLGRDQTAFDVISSYAEAILGGPVTLNRDGNFDLPVTSKVRKCLMSMLVETARSHDPKFSNNCTQFALNGTLAALNCKEELTLKVQVFETLNLKGTTANGGPNYGKGETKINSIDSARMPKDSMVPKKTTGQQTWTFVFLITVPATAFVPLLELESPVESSTESSDDTQALSEAAHSPRPRKRGAPQSGPGDLGDVDNSEIMVTLRALERKVDEVDSKIDKVLLLLPSQVGDQLGTPRRASTAELGRSQAPSPPGRATSGRRTRGAGHVDAEALARRLRGALLENFTMATLLPICQLYPSCFADAGQSTWDDIDAAATDIINYLRGEGGPELQADQTSFADKLGDISTVVKWAAIELYKAPHVQVALVLIV